MKISDIKKTLVIKKRNEGLPQFFINIIYYALSSIFSYKKYILMNRSLLDPIPEVKIKKNFSIRIADYSDLPKLAKVVTPNILKNFTRFFSEEKVCLIALDKDDIIYYSWISFEQKSFVRIKEDEAYFFDAFTLPKYRSMGIHTMMTAERLRIARQRGYDNALLIVSPRNLAALKALKKLGFEETGNAYSFESPIFKLAYSNVVQKEKGDTVETYRAFVCYHRRLYLYLLMLQEVVVSFFKKGFENFYNKWKILPEKEFIYLSENYDLNKIDRIVVIGGGAIPYSAIFFNRQLQKPTYVIERNRLAYFACSRLIHRLNLKSLKVIKGSAENFHDYINSLIIISLHTHIKQKILEHILKRSNHNNIIIIRHPFRITSDLYDNVDLNELECSSIEFRDLGLISLITNMKQ